MLEELGQNIWGSVADYHLGLLAIPHRMTVVRTASGGLVLHSPVEPDDAIRASLESLGPIEAIVWPSWWHDLYLREWAAACPAAKLYVSPSLQRATQSMSIAGILDETKPLWPEVEQLHIDRLAVNFNEFVFFHRPGRCLIVADLVVNVHDDLHMATKIFFHVIGAYPGPRIPSSYRLAVRDRSYLRAKFDRVLAWDFDCVIMGHGDVLASGGKAAFEKACAEFLS